jgi:cytochrome c
MKLTTIPLTAGVLLAVSITLSAVHPWGNLRASRHSPLLEGSTVPPEVRQVLETKCGDCHSGNTHWPAYSRLAPGSWLVERDVYKGRNHLDMSQWTQYDAQSQIDLLTKIGSEARSGGMPVSQYLLLHPGKRLSDAEAQLIYDWARSERKLVRKRLPQTPDENSTK